MATRVRPPASTKSLSLEAAPEPSVPAPPRRRPAPRPSGPSPTPRSPSTRRSKSSAASHRALNLAELDTPPPPLPPAAVEESPAPPPAAPLPVAPKSPPPPPPPVADSAAMVALATTIDRLEQQLGSVREVVQATAQRGAEELARSAHQTVLLVTGVAHHLDKVAGQLGDIAGLLRAQVQTVARLEAAMVAMHEGLRSQLGAIQLPPPPSDQQLLQVIEKALAPVVAERAGRRVAEQRQQTIEQLESYRLQNELKQLRSAVEQSGGPAAIPTLVPRVVQALRGSRR